MNSNYEEIDRSLRKNEVSVESGNQSARGAGVQGRGTRWLKPLQKLYFIPF